MKFFVLLFLIAYLSVSLLKLLRAPLFFAYFRDQKSRKKWFQKGLLNQNFFDFVPLKIRNL